MFTYLAGAAASVDCVSGFLRLVEPPVSGRSERQAEGSSPLTVLGLLIKSFSRTGVIYHMIVREWGVNKDDHDDVRRIVKGTLAESSSLSRVK